MPGITLSVSDGMYTLSIHVHAKVCESSKLRGTWVHAWTLEVAKCAAETTGA